MTEPEQFTPGWTYTNMMIPNQNEKDSSAEGWRRGLRQRVDAEGVQIFRTGGQYGH